MEWRKLNGTVLNDNIEILLEKAIQEEQAKGHRLKVCIGTDSQVYKNKIEFATAVVIYREGRGGFMFIKDFRENRKFSIKERMIYEVSKSIEVAYPLCAILDKYNVELELHADINTDPQFKSNPALQEAMGYIKGMGFAFKAKPDAYASTNCANKVV
jgi:predicted RNase H-related nuclease YkuK (DUF458 family)